MTDTTGNLPPMPGVFPDYPTLIVRNGAGGRELTLARWGMPSPVFALQGKRTDPGVTNIRNATSLQPAAKLGLPMGPTRIPPGPLAATQLVPAASHCCRSGAIPKHAPAPALGWPPSAVCSAYPAPLLGSGRAAEPKIQFS